MKKIISDVVNFPNGCETVRFTDGEKLEWAKGLRNKTIRRMIADCFSFVRDHDEYMLEELRKGFI